VLLFATYGLGRFSGLYVRAFKSQPVKPIQAKVPFR
jgi:hypothetical protein